MLHAALFLVVAIAIASGARAETRLPLFTVENEKTNELRYYALLPDCRWDGRNPNIQARWYMVTKGGTEEEMDMFESPRFSVADGAVAEAPDRLRWRLKVFDKKPYLAPLAFVSSTAQAGGSCNIRTTITINSTKLELDRIRYELNFLKTDIKSITFFGRDVSGANRQVKLK